MWPGPINIIVPEPNSSHWCQKWDSHADKSQTTLVTMDRTRWPISKPVTRSMTHGDDEAKAGAGDPVTGGRQDSQVARELGLQIPVHGAASEDSSAVENQAAPRILGSALEQSHGDGVICSSALEPMTTAVPEIAVVSGTSGAMTSCLTTRPSIVSSLAVSVGNRAHSDPSINQPSVRSTVLTQMGTQSMGHLPLPRQSSGPVQGLHPSGIQHGQREPVLPAVSLGVFPGSGVEMGPFANQEWMGLGRGYRPVSVNSQASLQHLEPKVSIPLFHGKSEWRVFWMQFSRLAQRFGWVAEETRDRLVSCLRDEALEFYADLAAEVRGSLQLTAEAFSRQFDDQKLPETYRASLNSVHKGPKETTEEYAARVQKMAAKAFPGIAGTALLEELTIEYLFGGLPDHSLVYDIMTKKPRTVEAALDLIQWHESCRNLQRKRAGVRQVVGAQTDVSVQRVHGKAYVTEERLNRFGRDLKDGIVKELDARFQSKPRRRANANTNWKDSIECFRCHELGHLARECPSRSAEQHSSSKVSGDTEVVSPLN